MFHGFESRGAVHCRHCFTAGSPIRPGDGIQTLRWWLGLSFRETLAFVADALGGTTHGTGGTFGLSQRRSKQRQSDSELEGHSDFARQAFERIDQETRERLATSLAVPAGTLLSLRVGLTPDRNASTWPMRDAETTVIGVRLASLPWSQDECSKWSRRGSRSGLFLPRGDVIDRSRLWITEGASDTAAADGLGLWVIGRASCSASTEAASDYVGKYAARAVTVIADNDVPGIEGATRFARLLASHGTVVSVIVPPAGYGDLREWTRAGAGANDLRSRPPLETLRRPAQLTFAFTSQPTLTT
ncbi:MAG: hypothetical protein AAFX06_03470 [Planctomycetota bacterium]